MAGRYPTSNSNAGEERHLDEALQTAFVDGDIDDVELLAQVRAHLIRCDQCRRDVAELRALVSLLDELPEPALPRSFRLDPGMVPARIAPVSAEPAWYIRYQPALRRMTALAAVLLFSVLMVDVLVSNGTFDGQDADDSASVDVARTSGGQTASSGAGSSSESYALAETPAGGAAEATQEAAAGSVGETQEAAATEESAAGAADVSTETSGSEAAASTAAATETSSTATAASAGTEATGGGTEEAQPTEETVPASLQSQTEEAATPEADATSEAGASTNASDSTLASEPDTETIATTDSATDQGTSLLAVAELALALIVIWLLVVTVLLPRIRPAQR